MNEFTFTHESIVQSFELILQYIGVEWFEKNVAVKSDKRQHPLIEWYLLFPSWKENSTPQNIGSPTPPIVEIALLGQALQMISGDVKFNKLISRLKQPKEFYATAWEIVVAAAHIAQGLQVEFVEEQRTRTPDLRVTDRLGNTYWVECKNRVLEQDRQSQNIWKRIEDTLVKYLDKNNLNYQIALSMNGKLEPKDANYLRDFVIETIEHKFEPKSLLRVPGASIRVGDISNRVVLEIHKLAEPDTELDGNIFTLPVSLDQMDFGTFSCGRADLPNKQVVLVNPRAVIFCYTDSVRIEGVENTFKSALNQLPVSGSGVIHIRLSINSWVTDLSETVSRIQNFLRKELSGGFNRRVNAVVVTIYYTELVKEGAFRYPVYKGIPILVKHQNPLN